jgi:hypothetical protein
MENYCQITFFLIFIKLLVYIYTNAQVCLNFIFMILVTSFNFEVQIIYMRFKKKFKVNEISPIATFDTIHVVPNFSQSVYIIVWIHL